MKANIVKQTIGTITNFVGKNAPTILTGFAVIGVAATAVLAARGGIKAKEIIDEEHWSREEGNEPTKLEIVAKTWPEFVPAAVSLVASAACAIAANTINGRRITALAAALALNQENLKKFKDKAREMMGDKKVDEVEHEVNRDLVKNAGDWDDPGVPRVGRATTRCLDKLTGQLFWSTKEAVHQAFNQANADLFAGSGYLSANDLAYFLGIESSISGDLMGWRAEDGLIPFRFDSQLVDDEPCLVIDYPTLPRPQYY